MKKILKKRTDEDKNRFKSRLFYNLLIHRIDEIDSKIRAGMVLEKNSSRILGENS